MKCKCFELKEWLNKEVNYLDNLKKQINPNTRLYNVISGKIDAYLILIENFN